MEKTVNNTKPFKTYEEQLDILISRGLIVENREYAIQKLSQLNYYRISGYSLTLRKDDVFYEGTCFEDIIQIYNFDSKFRAYMMEELAHVEIYIKSLIGYEVARVGGPRALYDESAFALAEGYDSFRISLAQAIEQNKNEPFVKHHIHCYGSKFPSWAAVELLSFGQASKLFANLTPSYRDAIGSRFGNLPTYHIDSWLQCCSELRNKCAHRSRLFNRGFVPVNFTEAQKKYLKEHDLLVSQNWGNTLFATAIIIKKILEPSEYPLRFVEKIKQLQEAYPFVLVDHYGMPSDWEEIIINI